MYLKKGDRGSAVAILQKEGLKMKVKSYGYYGRLTTSAVIEYQNKHGLYIDGEAGDETLGHMGILEKCENSLSTDSMNISKNNSRGVTSGEIGGKEYTTKSGLLIREHFLPKSEYISGPIKNEYAFFHHTAGWNNPQAVIDQWGRDTRGKVATEFVLGGQKITNNDSNFDGLMLQAFPEGNQGWHLGTTGSRYMNTHSVALEMCSFGWLKDGKTYVGTKAHQDQITTLDKAFRGFTQWHKYSDAQIEGLRKWILFIADRDNIDVHVGIIQWLKAKGPEYAFEFQQGAYEGKVKGLLTHTNVRKDKWDNFPQPELCDMLMSI